MFKYNILGTNNLSDLIGQSKRWGALNRAIMAKKQEIELGKSGLIKCEVFVKK